MATYTQVETYEQDISGATNTNVGAIQFSEATSTAPRLTSWDTTGHSSTNKEILDGTTGTGGEAWLRGGITASNVTPGAGAGSLPAGWTTQLVSTETYQIKGDEHYQTAASAIDSGSQVRFVITAFVPSDAGAGTTGHDPVLTARYTYTGSAPTVTWYWNTGTEATPVWTEHTGSYTVYMTGPDTTTGLLDPVTAPLTDTKFPEELWFQTA